MNSVVHGNRGYVLVADDNVAARIQIASILEESGFSVVPVENGQEASSALQGHTFDVALLDVSMPDIDGPEIVPVARQVDVPVIGLSPARQAEDERWAAAGVALVVEKPVDRDMLLAALETALGGAEDDPVVDLAHLAQYTAGDKSIERELAGLFTTSSDRYLQTMLDTLDAGEWRVAAHSLKGAAKGIGAGEVARLAEHAEGLDVPADDQIRQKIVMDLREATGAVARYFQQYLNS